MIDREELAWAAGFFDGEGTTQMATRKEYSNIALSITQTGHFASDLLIRFNRAICGLGNLHKANYQTKAGNEIWTVTISNFENTQAAIALLWPFLGPAKRAQSTKALTLAKNHFNGLSEQGRRSYRSRVRNRMAA